MDEAWLGLAIQAVQNNELPRARELLWGYVRYHRTDSQGWFWLSRAVENGQERIKCLEYALQVNPGDTSARNELGTLNRSSSRIARQPAHASSSARPRQRSGTLYFPSFRQIRLPVFAIASSKDVFRWLFLGFALILFLIVGLSVVPLLMGNRTLIVSSGSMEPAIGTGSLAIAQPVPSNTLGFGDIIVFSPGSESQIPIIHRIVGMSERRGVRYYTTRGDANPSADKTEITLPATAWRVWTNIPLVGYLIVYATSPVGIILLIVIPLVVLLATTALGWANKRGVLQPSF